MVNFDLVTYSENNLEIDADVVSSRINSKHTPVILLKKVKMSQ